MELVASIHRGERQVWVEFFPIGRADKVAVIIDFHARHDRFPQKGPWGAKKHGETSPMQRVCMGGVMRNEGVVWPPIDHEYIYKRFQKTRVRCNIISVGLVCGKNVKIIG
jgi:hypothetical protein